MEAGFSKLVFNDAFDYGASDMPLVFLANDPDVMRKCASSSVVDEWGEIKPLKGHSLVHVTALGAFEKTGNNKNGDAFEEAICRSSHPSFVKNASLYRNHLMLPDKKEGFVYKSAYNEDMGRVELLIAADNQKCADWLQKLASGEPVSVSMGWHCQFDECSICGHKARGRKQWCEHVQKNASLPYGMNRILPDGRKCFVFNRSGHWNDISQVPVGADAIARDLRKVASLGNSDEVITGAELAEMYFLKSGAVDLTKLDVLRKLAAMEKQIEMMAVSQAPAPELAAVARRKLRSLPVPEAMSELAKTAAVLPLEDFYRFVFDAEDFESHRPAIQKAASGVHDCFSGLAGDYGRMAQVCSNQTYDCMPHAYSGGLSLHEMTSIAQSYSVDPEISVAREMKTASFGTVTPKPSSAGLDTASTYLLDQYAAYKLSALVGAGMGENYSALFSSLLHS